MSSEKSEYTVKVYRRKKRAEEDRDVEVFPYQADIFGEGFDHHGVGASPQLALLRAAQHWNKHAD